MNKFALLLSLSVLCGCATSFQGSAHFEGGQGACLQKCSEEGLVMSGLVFMGAYSSACVCERAGKDQHAATGAGAAVGGGSAGVMTAMNAQAAAMYMTTFFLLGTFTAAGVGAGG